MELASWNEILAEVDGLKLLASEGKWDELLLKSDSLDPAIRHFFESILPGLNKDEQAYVKESGNVLMQDLANVVSLAQKEKKETSKAAGKMAQGRKGISAYKST